MAGSVDVDVILPTHRRPHTIAASIASALRQTHRDFRLHVVADGIGADTEAAVRSFADDRIELHRFEKGMGFGYAHRNVVLRRTTAPFVAYLTDDDLWFPDHLERGLAELEARGVGLVALRACHVRFPDTLDPHFFAYDWPARPFGAPLRNWFTGAVNCVHRRSVFERVGYWNEALFRFGDRELYNRIRTSDAGSAFVDHVTVLRFFAQNWDPRYAGLAAPPQPRYLDRLADPAWVAALRERARPGARTAVERGRQARDFFEFGIRSGPKLVRFLWQRWNAPAPRGGARAEGEIGAARS